MKETRQKAIHYGDMHKPDKSVIMTVAGVTNSKIDFDSYEKGEVSVCTFIEELQKESMTEGRAEEIVETGYEFHLSENDIIERLQRKLDISLQQAQTYFTAYKKSSVSDTSPKGGICQSYPD